MTPIADMVRKMFEKGVDREAILIAIEAAEQVMSMGVSTRHQVDEAAERRRAWDREYRRNKRTERPPDPPDIHPNPPDVGNSALSFLEESKKHSVEESKKEKKERGTKIPPDWKPKHKHYEEGLKRGMSRSIVDELADNMRTWCAANANRSITTKADWDATFMGFIRRENSNGTRNYNSQRRSSGADFFAGLASVAADIVGDDPSPRTAEPEIPLGRYNIDG